jgi:hypothetical protein
MMDPVLAQTLETLRQSLADRLGAQGRDLATAARRAGRRIPRRLRPAMATLAEAERTAANPRLARLVDAGQVEAAAHDLSLWLATQDPRERRKTAIVNAAARIALALLVTGGLVITVLVWRGIV